METFNGFNMNYSSQAGKFIESKHFANSFYKETDLRTWVCYYQDRNGLIHSSSFNYSIINSQPVTVERFNEFVSKNSDTSVSIV